MAKTFDTNLKDLFAQYPADLAAMLGFSERRSAADSRLQQLLSA